MSWKDIVKRHKEPMDRVSTTASTGQDEEAAKRTEDKEAELLAMIRERNKAARKKPNQPVEKLIEWVEG